MNKMLFMIKIGNILRKKAAELGISDAEVARRSGIAERTYAYYVDDSRKPPFDKLVKICKTLNITPNYLFGFEEASYISTSANAMFSIDVLSDALSAALRFYTKYSTENDIPAESLAEITLAAYEEVIKEDIKPTSNVVYISMVNKFNANRA